MAVPRCMLEAMSTAVHGVTPPRLTVPDLHLRRFKFELFFQLVQKHQDHVPCTVLKIIDCLSFVETSTALKQPRKQNKCTFILKTSPNFWEIP